MTDLALADPQSVRDEDARIIDEFQALIDRVGHEVAEASLAPILRGLLEDWTKRVDAHEGRVGLYLEQLRLAGETVPSAVRGAGTEAASAVYHAAQTLLVSWTDARDQVLSLQRATVDLHARLDGLTDRSAHQWQRALDGLLTSYEALIKESDVPDHIERIAEETTELARARQHLLGSVDRLEQHAAEIRTVLDRHEAFLPTAIKTMQAEFGAGLERADRAAGTLRAELATHVDQVANTLTTTSNAILMDALGIAERVAVETTRTQAAVKGLEGDLHARLERLETEHRNLALTLDGFRLATDHKRRVDTAAAVTLLVAAAAIVACQLWPAAILRWLTSLGLHL